MLSLYADNQSKGFQERLIRIMKINRYGHDTSKLMNTDVRVDDDEKYRIMVYDRKDDVYYFIKKTERKEGYETELFGIKSYVARYECLRAYVFYKKQTLPTFSVALANDVYEWAKSQCIEMRSIPDWWKAEIHDLDYGYRCTSKKVHVRNKKKPKDLQGKLHGPAEQNIGYLTDYGYGYCSSRYDFGIDAYYRKYHNEYEYYI